MADELRLIFIIIGALVLGALLLHGLWTVRKNAGQVKHRYFDETSAGGDEKPEDFDDLGVGPVRVVKKSATEPQVASASAPSTSTANVTQSRVAAATAATAATSSKREAPLPELQNELPFDEPAQSALNFSALPDEELTQDVLSEPDTTEPEPASSAPAEPAEVLILYVLLPEHKDMKGPDLLSALLTLGFKYGDMDIFHRHQDSAGAGAVLFSLANMFNPGTFELDNIDKLSTRGVSLFMTLPGPGEPLQNFNLMHNAAKKLAEEFGGQVLDGQRSVLTVQTVRHYVDKIREFQRQQLIHG